MPSRAPSTGPPTAPATTPASGPSGIPTGPRSASSTHPAAWGNAPPRASFSSTSNTYPRTQRFDAPRAPAVPYVHQALQNLPRIIPGGQKDPTASGLPLDIQARLKRTEDEAEKLREELRIKEEKMRKGLKLWNKLERESASMGLRSEISERQVRIMAGEGVGGAAF